jgi:hypothetical protein
MKTSLLALLAFAVSLTLAPAQQPEPPKDAEKLPEYPKLDPKNTVKALNPDSTIFAEVANVDDNKKVVRIGLACEVCLRIGLLEIFMCKKGTKEHESIVRINADAKFIHAALVAAGAKPGTPTQFIDPKTEEPKYKPATGTKINVTVHYTKDGKTHTHPAQDWIIDREKSKKAKKDVILPHGWVFAGSVEIKDPCDPTKPAFYGANSGDVISISNFPYSMLEVPAEISKDDDSLQYEARTEMIPPLFSKVWVILEPAK